MIVHISTTKKRVVAILGAAFIGAAITPPGASAQTVTTLVSFDATHGAIPYYGSLIADASGNFFGTTYFGGASGNGTVFEIVKMSSGYASVPTILFNFEGVNGAHPAAGLIADANGNLFGTTTGGGSSGSGTLFEIAKTSTGYASTPTILFNFDGVNGANPFAGLIADASGNLFGTTTNGGAYGNGTVFEIAKTPTGDASAPTILFSFDGVNGANPFAGLTADASGNLFGTTVFGGAFQGGTVFEISRTSAGYASTPTILVNFEFSDGARPFAGLLADTNGNLFGTTNIGGIGYGTVFEIAKTSTGYASTPTILFNFDFTNGMFPRGGLIADANGNLFGTTTGGGSSASGTVFEIAKTSTGYASTPTILLNFDGVNGAIPWAGLLADANGNLFGTTTGGGAFGGGTVFEIAGSGFVPLVRFAGVPGTSNCHGVSTSTLAHTYGGIAAAAKALGYASVANLQSAISAYCGN